MTHQISNLPLVPDLALLWQVPQLLTPPSFSPAIASRLHCVPALRLVWGALHRPAESPYFFFILVQQLFLAADRRSPAAFHQDFSNFNLAYAQSQLRTTESLNRQKSDHCDLFNPFCLHHFPNLQVIMGNSATNEKADADRGRFFVALSFSKDSHILVLQSMFLHCLWPLKVFPSSS